MALYPVVADMNHANPIGLRGDEAAGFAAMRAAGLVGIIHKARQGVGFGDPKFAARRDLAREAGLLVGAYDFATHDVVADNVADFLAFTDARADPALSLWLDFEDNRASQMTAAQAKEFLDRVDQSTGRACGIYGGNRIAEQVKDGDPWWAGHPLWLCQYKTAASLRNADLAALKPHITVPPPWQAWFLLQYSGDGVGPLPHTVPGLENGADLNVFDGAPADLAAQWVRAMPKPSN
jgi:lysozyme